MPLPALARDERAARGRAAGRGQGRGVPRRGSPLGEGPPPFCIEGRPQVALRKKWCILVDGDRVPPPVKSFEGMGLPGDLLSALREKNIKRPTPIQVQGMPVALAGRDMIGAARRRWKPVVWLRCCTSTTLQTSV